MNVLQDDIEVASTTSTGVGQRHSSLLTLGVAVAALVGLTAMAAPTSGASDEVTYLSGDDFTYGTYIIDRPGTYRLAEDISFNPNSPDTLTAAISDGQIPDEVARTLGLPFPVDAYHAGLPLPAQLAPGGVAEFAPGGPLDARYDPAAFGLGFFAAIAITADDVVLDLAGHTIEQSDEHALLQRFFALIELADQPFVPDQGPASFGSELRSAERVTIKGGTIGRSAHHGIHGNGNADVTVADVDFDGYEVAAIALNGVEGLEVRDVTAVNHKAVPVLGTYSAGRFMEAYVDYLVDSGSAVTLTVGDAVLSASDVQAALRDAINSAHHDLVAQPNLLDGRVQIDATLHPAEYALFHNPSGLVDGNSYSFLVNQLGVAVNGFTHAPDGVGQVPSRNILFEDVVVNDQQAQVREIVAIDAGDDALVDAAGAVFQVRNLHPDTDTPITITSTDDGQARYIGNQVANAQALVAKAAAAGDFEGSHLDVSRSNMPASVLAWIEGEPGSETLADIAVSYYCNGDSMFHVNKGVIAFKMDGAEDVTLRQTAVHGLANVGAEGSTVCGEYLESQSHPLATLPGYGGATARAYTFAGSTGVLVEDSEATGIVTAQGPACGFAVLTDTSDVRFDGATIRDVVAGVDEPTDPDGSTPPSKAMGFEVSAEAADIVIDRGCAVELAGAEGERFIDDAGTSTIVSNTCEALG